MTSFHFSATSKEKDVIFFKGGCDLQQMLFYLRSYDFNIAWEVNYVSKTGIPVHQEHTHVLLQSLSLEDCTKQMIAKDKDIPFIDENYFKTHIFNKKYDFLERNTITIKKTRCLSN